MKGIAARNRTMRTEGFKLFAPFAFARSACLFPRIFARVHVRAGPANSRPFGNWLPRLQPRRKRLPPALFDCRRVDLPKQVARLALFCLFRTKERIPVWCTSATRNWAFSANWIPDGTSVGCRTCLDRMGSSQFAGTIRRKRAFRLDSLSGKSTPARSHFMQTTLHADI